MADELPVLPFASKAQFRAWMEEHHTDPGGLWIKFAKKGTGVSTVVYAEALEVALCFGWIDGQVKRFDETYYLQKFTPRRARSRWSKINVAKATELIESGAMQPAGRPEIERAQAAGRWHAASDPPSKIGVPPDLQAELDK